MKIKIICDKDAELLKLRCNLKKELLKGKYNEKYKIKFMPKSCKEADIYLIISNDLEFIYKNSYEFEMKNGIGSNLIILTSNLKSANIVGCLNITPYVYYIKSKIESIAFKIIKIYNKNNISDTLYTIPVKNKKDS